MRVLLVHPSPLMYSEIYLRLEPLGVERVAAALLAAGHEVRLLDLQLFSHDDLARALGDFAPRAVGFSVNYLANVPEVIDLARLAKRARPECFVFVGGHSASFVAREILDHAEGAVDCVVRGEGELVAPRLVKTQGILNRKHLGVRALAITGRIAARLALRGQTNFLRMIWKFRSVYNPERQLRDHFQPITYAMTPPAPQRGPVDRAALYIHAAARRDPASSISARPADAAMKDVTWHGISEV